MFKSISNQKNTAAKSGIEIKKLENKEKNAKNYTSKAYYNNLKGRLYQKQGLYSKALIAYKAAIKAGENHKMPAVHAIHAAYHIGWLYRHGHLETSGNVNTYDYALAYFHEAAGQLKELENFVKTLKNKNNKDQKLYRSIINKYKSALPVKAKECIKLKKSLANNLRILQEQERRFNEQRQQLQQQSILETFIKMIFEKRQQDSAKIEVEVNLAQGVGLRPFYDTVQNYLSQVLASYYLANANVLAIAPSEWLQKAKAGYALIDKTLGIIAGAIPFPGVNPIGLAGASLNLFAEASFQLREQKENKDNANKAAKISKCFHSFESITEFTKQCCDILVDRNGDFLKMNMQFFHYNAQKAINFGELTAQQLICNLLDFNFEKTAFNAESFIQKFIDTKIKEQNLKNNNKYEENILLKEKKQKEKEDMTEEKNNSSDKPLSHSSQNELAIYIESDIEWCFEVLYQPPTPKTAQQGKFYWVKNSQTMEHELYVKNEENTIERLDITKDIPALNQILPDLNKDKLKTYEKLTIQEMLLSYKKETSEHLQHEEAAPELDKTPHELFLAIQNEFKAKLSVENADSGYELRKNRANLDKLGFFAMGIKHKNSDIAKSYDIKESDIIEEFPKGCTII